MSSILTGKKIYNGFVLNPVNQIEYLYDSAEGGNPEYLHPVMNVKAWNEHQSQRGASITPESDPLMLSDVFYDTIIPGNDENMTFTDLAKNVLQEHQNAKRDHDLQRAAAIITSKDMAAFQETVVLGQNVVTTRTGVLTGLFESVSVPNLKGEWATFDDGIKYFLNVAEGTTVEPSGGTGSIVTVEIPKNEGAVAITDRAQMVINGDNPYTRLSARLGQERLKSENAVVAAEIESNTAHTTAGVNFGARTSMLSTTNPIDMWNTIINTFDGLNKNMFNLIVSRSAVQLDYNANDIVVGRGSSGGPPLQQAGNVNETVQQGVPGLSGGIRWAADNAITATTAMWVLWDGAIKVFRGPLTLFGVRKEEIEYTKTVLRAYMTAETVDTDLIYQVTGVDT